MRQRINLVCKKDLDIDTFRGSGPGGQHRNKTDTGVRITHRASGAVGQASDSKSQEMNKRAAFRRMIATPEFQVWLDLEVHPENVRVEIRRDGEWVKGHLGGERPTAAG